jgi:two-component system sensor histidine kinase VanS
MVILFENQGKDIPKEKLDRIFEKFFRLDGSRRSHTGGAGLGLAIAKEIVELHGGTIAAKSENHRVSFTVKLPLSS